MSTQPTDTPRPLNAENLLGDKPLTLYVDRSVEFADLDSAREYLRRVGEATHYLCGGVSLAYRVLPRSDLGMLERETSRTLERQVREFATDVRTGGWTLDQLMREPDWCALRATYLLYCAGIEDALYQRAGLLAAATRKNDPHWFGQIALEAWNEYADERLVKLVRAKVEELAEDAGATMQAEAVGK
jgi:hypothetical protein